MSKELCNSLCSNLNIDEKGKEKCIDECQKTLATQMMNFIENIFKSDSIFNFSLLLGKPLFDLADSLSDLKLAQIYSKYENTNPIEKVKIHLKEVMRLIHDPDLNVNDDIINATVFSCAIVSYLLENKFDKALELVNDIKRIIERLTSLR